MKIKIFFASLLLVFTSSCTNSQNFKSVDVALFETELKKTENPQIVDVRTPEEYNAGRIDNAKNCNWNGDSFDADVAQLDKNKAVFVYCLSGGRSKKAASRLAELGFKNIIELDGGYMSWDKAHPKKNETWTGMTVEAYEALLKKDKIVLIDFYAKWCAPCKKMEPFLEKMTTEYQGKAAIYRIDADQNKSLFKHLGYEGLPVVLIFKEGKLSFQKNEFVSEEELRKELE